jgi:LmbE family N-acetylglucosaminyl deacetylase
MDLNLKNKNILVLAPHTDDGELGMGGSINYFIEQGKNVVYAAFSTAEQSVPPGFPKDILKTEVKNATRKLGVESKNLLLFNYEVRKLNYFRQEILEDLVQLKNSLDFDLVFIPSLHDIHQDHTTIAQEGLRAFKNSTLLGYELIWNNLTFNTQCFIKLQKNHIDAKVNALKEYKSQGSRDYLSSDFIFSLAKTRGVQVGCEYAEAFEVVRLFL